jgi:3-deoxy-manno-octulosonate cytidylyltransferase (CMP-KDO synthetase)
MDKYVGIIPARYQSSRFPGKPLCDILGKPMIWYVYQSVMKWSHWDRVWIATDSKEIMDKCDELEIPAIMTKDCHQDCLDRASEVVEILEAECMVGDKYIIIQGDEPLFNVETLNVDLSPPIINFYTEVHDKYDMYDANAVKVVVSKGLKALYFSRYTVPYHDEKTKRTDEEVKVYKQIGVYVFTGEMLKLYNELRSSHLENMEGIGLNRLLENDVDIHMRYTIYDSISVDTPDDRNRIISIIKNEYKKVDMSIDDNGNVLGCDGFSIRKP